MNAHQKKLLIPGGAQNNCPRLPLFDRRLTRYCVTKRINLNEPTNMPYYSTPLIEVVEVAMTGISVNFLQLKQGPLTHIL